MRILIIGAGAVGSFLGVRLALGGHRVLLVGRAGLVDAVSRGGLMLSEPGQPPQQASVRAVSRLSDAFTGAERYDLAIITTKSYDTKTVIAELMAAAGSNPPPLLTLQNGVGNEEALAQAFGGASIVSGAIDTPVSVPAPGQVQVHRAAYRVGLAPVGGRQPLELARTALETAGLQVNIYGDYRGLKWTKLLMNMLANATSAILDWTPAQVMADSLAARLEARAWQEALAVMAAAKIAPVALAGYPIPQFAPFARRLPRAWLGRILRVFVSGGRGSKMPSLHIALHTGGRTEVDWLNGAVAHWGEERDVPVPVNTLLAHLVSALAAVERPREEFRGRPDQLNAMLDRAVLSPAGQ